MQTSLVKRRGLTDVWPRLNEDPSLLAADAAAWERFDAGGLFDEIPRLHANKVIYDDFVGLDSSSGAPDTGHEDELMVGESSSYEADERELQADKEEGTPPAGHQAPDGADKPIQRESEGVDEVAEATSKTSEDVHGGDEATKDIEGSPNAANDGQDPENHGAEDGEGGETGEGQSPDASTDQSSPEGKQATAEDPSDAAVFDPGDWEAHADQTALAQQVADALAQVAAVRPASAAGGGVGVDYSGETWDVESLRAVFIRTRELIKKLVSEEDYANREGGSSRWWANEVAKNAVSFRHARIPGSRYDRPKTNNIVFFMDVSGSVSTLAELFMAIMGGAAGLPGVRIVVGSEAHAEDEIVVDKPFRTVEAAVEFFRSAVNAHVCDDPYCTSCKGKISHVGWHRDYEKSFEPGVVEFLKVHNLYHPTTTCVFFGDMQGVNFTTSELRRIVRGVKCLWLFTDGPGHYTHTGDLPRSVEAGLPIVYNVWSAQSFAHAVKRLR